MDKMECETSADERQSQTENKSEKLLKWDNLHNALNDIEMEARPQPQQNESCPYEEEWKAHKEQRRKELDLYLKQMKYINEIKLKMELRTPTSQAHQTAQ